jgi:hypothetical protein
MKTSIKLNKSCYLTLALFCFITLNSCKNSENKLVSNEKSSVIKPPFDGVEVKADQFSFDASEDSEIITKEGTTIRIPANSLVDAKGKAVKGKVNLSYRSINTPAEIIASGIPMSYDSSGVKYDFISAGMFEIGAKQKGKDLEIASGKAIDVEFASYKSGDDFFFYKIDTETGKWDYKGISTPKENKLKKEKLKLFEDDNLFQLEIDYSLRPELKPFNGLKWLCLDKTEKDNPITNKWILDEIWYDIILNPIDAKKGIYKMILSNSSKVVSFKVSPYLLESENKADFAEKIKNLNETIKLKKAEEEKIQFEADIIRNYKISSFGLYNWDKLDKLVESGELAVLDASFLIDSKQLEDDMSVFHFSGKDKLLSRVTKKWDKMIIDPKGVNKILIVLAGNLVAVSEYAVFIKAQGSKNFLFNLKKRAKKINSLQDIDAILNE